MAGLEIGLRIIDERVPQAARILVFHQRADLLQVGFEQEVAQAVAGRQIEQLDEFGNGDGHPAIAACPQRIGEMVPAVEGPAVEPQPGLAIDQVLDVQHELAARLFDVLRAA